MLATQHIRGGAVGGLGVAILAGEYTGFVSIADSLVFAAVAGGAALLPDWDARNSTITKSLPIFTVPMHHLIKWTHRAVYSATRRGLDPVSRTKTGWRTAHRGLTHSVPSAVIISVLLAAVLYAAGWLAPLILIIALVLLAGDVVFAGPLLLAYAAATFWRFGAESLAHIYSLSWLWTLGVLVGWLAHLAGDCPTTAGIPIFAPFTWKKLVLPVSFRAGGWFELYVVKFALIGAMGYMLFLLAAPSLASALDRVVGVAG